MSPVPPLGELNALILAETASFPSGPYRFEPGAPTSTEDNPRDPAHDGTGEDLWVGTRLLARGTPDRATYCCGVVLAVVARAWRWWATREEVPFALADLSETEASALVNEWFCPTLGHSGVVSALVSRRWGLEVSLDMAVAGDLCQFWRSTEVGQASGHQVVVLDVLTDDDGERVLRYWSSQRATGGPGVHEERILPEWEIHVVRAGA